MLVLDTKLCHHCVCICLAPNGARPSAGTVMTTKWPIFSFRHSLRFFAESKMLSELASTGDMIENGCQNLMTSRGTSSINKHVGATYWIENPTQQKHNKIDTKACLLDVEMMLVNDVDRNYDQLHTTDLLWDKFQWILPLYMKPISFLSKASVVCSVTAAIFIDFCLKKLNVFSQHIGQKNKLISEFRRTNP